LTQRKQGDPEDEKHEESQAFCHYIEKHGGSPSPTLEKMQSLGKTLQSQ